jgi:2-polyprenyl-3-methyl-5-hydroxy-6-metoxy-1,4-benzoquinol methylase
MSNDIWGEVARRVDDHSYMSGVTRTKARVDATGELFTPTALVIEMIRSQPLATWGPGKTVLDPACGDGQFLVAVKWVKVLLHAMSEQDALADVYGVDIMRDNVDLTKKRLGGGVVVMGNSLKPQMSLVGQTKAEHQAMLRLFT